MKNKKNFLITGYHFYGWHGSLVHICELAKELNSLGYCVYLAGVEISFEIKELVKDFAKLYFFDNLPLNIEYEYVLAYHEPICTYLLNKGLKYNKLAIGSLSKFVECEIPSVLCKYGFPLVVNSKENEIYQKSIFESDNLNPYVFVNSAPLNFMKDVNLTGVLKNIVIVSNHLPEELLNAAVYLKDKNIQVDIIGKGYKYLRITPELLSNYDLVITIGKTVQYALSLGIPVYNYDHFGGAGYITPDNIDKEEFYNFSGRSENRKISAEQIYNEILSGYEQSFRNIKELKNIARNRYNLKDNISRLLDFLNTTSLQLPNTPEWRIYEARCVQYAKTIINYSKIFNNVNKLLKPLKIFYTIINKLSFKKFYKNKLEQLEVLSLFEVD